MLLHTNSHNNLSHFSAKSKPSSKVVTIMRGHREVQLLSPKRQVRPKRVRKKTKKANSVERSGVRDFISKKVSPPSTTRLPPFSPLELSLQTPHILLSNGEPLEKLPSTKTRPIPSSFNTRDFTRRMLFQLVYLGDEDQNVEVEEVDEIDFAKLKTRLNEGKSVFITRRQSEKIGLSTVNGQGENKNNLSPWYINHV